jgi:hypothetical protein
LNFGRRVWQKELKLDVLELDLWMGGAIIDKQYDLSLFNSEFAVPTLQPLFKNVAWK